MLVLDVAGDVVVHALVRPELGQGLEHGRVEQVGRVEDGLAQDRLEHIELGAVLVDELLEAGGVFGGVRADPLGHLLEVLGGVEDQRLAALAADHQAVHRVEAGHGKVVGRFLAGGGEDLVEDVGHQEEGGAAVESEGAAGGLEAVLAGASADVILGFVDRDAAAAGGEQDGRGEPARAGSDDGDARLLRAGHAGPPADGTVGKRGRRRPPTPPHMKSVRGFAGVGTPDAACVGGAARLVQ